MTSFLFRRTSAFVFFMFFFLLFMSTVSAMARHAPATEKMHGYKDDEEYDENPVLSDPFHKGSFLSGVLREQKLTLKFYAKKTHNQRLANQPTVSVI